MRGLLGDHLSNSSLEQRSGETFSACRQLIPRLLGCSFYGDCDVLGSRCIEEDTGAVLNNRVEKPTGSQDYRWTSEAGRFERRQPVVFERSEDKGCCVSVKRTKRGVIDLTQESNIWTREALDVLPSRAMAHDHEASTGDEADRVGDRPHVLIQQKSRNAEEESRLQTKKLVVRTIWRERSGAAVTPRHPVHRLPGSHLP